ncbi:MAG: hypothetical protein ACK4RG_06685 [Fimbriimonadales bacterium]
MAWTVLSKRVSSAERRRYGSARTGVSVPRGGLDSLAQARLVGRTPTLRFARTGMSVLRS